MNTGYYIERGGRYLGSMGWVSTHVPALRFDSMPAAHDGIDDLRRAHPALLLGPVRVVERQIDWSAGQGGDIHVAYDPFGVQA
jgi:hypothetical protein